MQDAEIITRESGYLVSAEGPGSGTSVDRLPALRDVALWVIDGYDYYLSNDTMRALAEITDSGGVASIELETDKGSVTMTVAYSAPAKEGQAHD
ncbi:MULTISPECIES: hypothetical protein [unclassified Streptomyces]|uniref:hypothetical protein n=1 Tax=unclassified Streptomyces TaxID=2593676 RepID=UPI0004C08AFE|nr:MULTISPECIES: hypothetical protein [unclassified Streptomyces]